MDSNCICIFSNNSQGITIQDYLIQKYFYFWIKFLMTKAAAMFTIQRHSSAVKAPGKASVLENFLWTNGNFFLFWSITQNCCDMWFYCVFSKRLENLPPLKRWSYVKSKCLLIATSFKIYPHKSNVPLLQLAASLKIAFGLHKESVLPFAKELLSFFSCGKRLDNIRGTMKHISNILMAQDLHAKYNSLVVFWRSTSHTSVKLSLSLLRPVTLSREYQNLLHSVSVLCNPFSLNCASSDR